jgi:hypothetical protein
LRNLQNLRLEHFLPGSSNPESGLTGGRRWWAPLELTRMNIELTFPMNEVEDLMNVRGVGEKSFLKLKPLVTVAAKGEQAGQ